MKRGAGQVAVVTVTV